MSSLDLSAAFDVVNVELLIKRLNRIGLPEDLIQLVHIWLTERYYYISLESGNSYVHTCTVGTVQGSIMGPILYALFVSPLLDLAKMTLFADDNYIIKTNCNLEVLINDMKEVLEMITKWLKDSGLKVNDTKTEACLFNVRDHPTIEININNNVIKTKPSMNVLGVQFDSKLQWNHHVQNTVSKLKKVLQSITIIRKYFNKQELLSIITSNYYSVMYYNAEIWLLPNLSPNIKKQLLSASAAPLKMFGYGLNQLVSYERLHKMCGRATPDQVTKYKIALMLHKCHDDQNQGSDWLSINFNQNFNARQQHIYFFKTNRYKIGNNLLSNRLNILNGSITYDMLNLSFAQYKLKVKEMFLCKL